MNYTSKEIKELINGTSDADLAKYGAALYELAAILRSMEEAQAVAWVADLAPGIERPKEYMGIFTPHKSYADWMATNSDYVVTPLFTHPLAESSEVIRWQDHDGLDVWTIRPTFGETFEVVRRNQIPTKQQGTDAQWDVMSDYEKGEVHGWNECIDAMSAESREN